MIWKENHQNPPVTKVDNENSMCYPVCEPWMLGKSWGKLGVKFWFLLKDVEDVEKYRFSCLFFPCIYGIIAPHFTEKGIVTV